MAVTTLLDQFDIAAPRLDRGARTAAHGSFAGSALPKPGRLVPPPLPGLFSRWLRVSPRARSQRVPFASRSSWMVRAGREPSLTDHERMRAALGRCVAAVQAAHLIGEGAGHTPARGNP